MTSIIILAAGLSSRMGKPKQLLPWGEQSLIKHVVNVALESDVGPVAVVLGSSADLIYPEIQNERVHVIHNELYHEGQGTSVKAGAQWAKLNQYSGVIFMVCDQPYITASDLKLIADRGTENPDLIVASHYAASLGVPAYFGAHHYDSLMNVASDQGAKAVIMSAVKDFDALIEQVELPHALHDLDTPEDYSRLSAPSFESSL